MRSPVATALAIAVGIILLIGYFFPVGAFVEINNTLLNWAVILASVAGLVAIANLVGLHVRKARAPKERDIYSLFLVIAFAVTLLGGIVERVLKPSAPQFDKVVTAIQVPVEASLMAVLAVSLMVAGVRFFKYRKGLMPVVFIASALVFLLISSGLPSLAEGIPAFNQTIQFLNRLPLAGARGILLGVALGSLTAGLRILMGADRPYSG